jgi:hypothetical protein
MMLEAKLKDIKRQVEELQWAQRKAEERDDHTTAARIQEDITDCWESFYYIAVQEMGL